jgi:hypothetical protein
MSITKIVIIVTLLATIVTAGAAIIASNPEPIDRDEPTPPMPIGTIAVITMIPPSPYPGPIDPWATPPYPGPLP